MSQRELAEHINVKSEPHSIHRHRLKWARDSHAGDICKTVKAGVTHMIRNYGRCHRDVIRVGYVEMNPRDTDVVLHRLRFRRTVTSEDVVPRDNRRLQRRLANARGDARKHQMLSTARHGASLFHSAKLGLTSRSLKSRALRSLRILGSGLTSCLVTHGEMRATDRPHSRFLSPPRIAVVLCVDEKSRIRALDRANVTAWLYPVEVIFAIIT